MLTAFCERAVAVGLPLNRASVIVDTLYPIHEGRLFRWQRGAKETTLSEYGRSYPEFAPC